MKIGFIGLGRMGHNMVLNLTEHKHEVVGYNRNPKPTRSLSKIKGFTPSYSLKELTNILQKNTGKIIWLMISSNAVDIVLKQLMPFLKRKDIIIDGGNSYFKDSIRRYFELKKKGIKFLDVGTSGGIEGARNGACMMIGGDKKIYQKVEKLFRDMCVKNGYGYMGKAGSGHFVKMVHNGIEYGMMGSIAEGIQAVKEYPLKIDYKEAVKVYSHGSIIESRLMSWVFKAFNKKRYLKTISGIVPKGETEEEMEKLEKITHMEILREARKMRADTRKNPRYAGKIISAMRNQFGRHHTIKKRK